MKNFYNVGFDNAGRWNGVGGCYGLKAARALAAEVAEEYGEQPEIRKVTTREALHEEPCTIGNPYL